MIIVGKILKFEWCIVDIYVYNYYSESFLMHKL